MRDESATPELREVALELLIWADTRRGDLAAGVESWRRLAALKRDPKRRFEAARTLIAALRDAGQGDQGQALLEECRKNLPILLVAAS